VTEEVHTYISSLMVKSTERLLYSKCHSSTEEEHCVKDNGLTELQHHFLYNLWNFAEDKLHLSAEGNCSSQCSCASLQYN